MSCSAAIAFAKDGGRGCHGETDVGKVGGIVLRLGVKECGISTTTPPWEVP